MQYYQCDKYPIEFVLSENIDKHFDSHNHVGHYVISVVMLGTVAVYYLIIGNWFYRKRRLALRRLNGQNIRHSIMQAGVPHEVTAGSEGLYLFAKFMPALC